MKNKLYKDARREVRRGDRTEMPRKEKGHWEREEKTSRRKYEKRNARERKGEISGKLEEKWMEKEEK